MALLFGAATSDRVECGAGSSLATLDPWTYIAWIYPTTITSSRIAGFHKGSGGTTQRRLRIDNASGHLSVFLNRTGGGSADTTYVSNNNPLTTNKWFLICATFNSAGGAGQVVNIYVGDLNTLAVENTYSTATDGSGTVGSDSADTFRIGNSGGTNVAFQGRIAVCAYIAAELTLAQIRDWQFNPRVIDNTRLFMHLGFAGTGTQADWSGKQNAGTVTGATVAPHVPMRPPFRTFGGWEDIISAGPGLQTISPSGIVSAQEFGTQKLNLYALPSAIASAEAFGATRLGLYLNPSAIAGAEAFGTPTLIPGVATISPSGIASAETFGITKLTLYLLASAIGSQEIFGSAEVKLVQSISPTGIASAEGLGSPQLNLRMLLNAIASTEAFGTARLGLYLLPSALASGEEFGAATVRNVIRILPNGIDSGEIFGTAQLNLRALLNAIASAEAFGATRLGLYLNPSAIGSQEAFGSHILKQISAVLPNGIASAEAFGAAKLNFTIGVIGIAPGETFGTLRLMLYARPNGVGSAEAFGFPTIGEAIDKTIQANGIISAEAFGIPQINLRVIAVGILSGEIFGITTLFHLKVFLYRIAMLSRAISADLAAPGVAEDVTLVRRIDGEVST